MSDQFQDDGIGTHPGAAESSFDLAVDAICDLVEGDGNGAPPPAEPSTQPIDASHPINKNPAEGEVYINKDGKKVRRVKRSEKRMRQKQLEATDAAAPAIEASSIAPIPTERGAALSSNQKAQSEAEAQRAAAAAASAALLGTGALAASIAGSDSHAIADNVGSTNNMPAPTSSFDRDPNTSGIDDYSTNSDEDEGKDDGDWDLDYKTGLAKQHEDAERKMLEGEEGRRGFESTDDEDDYDDEGDDTMAEECANGLETASAMDGTSFANASTAQVGIAASSNSNPMEAETTIPTMSVEPKNPFADEQLKVSNDPMANVPLPPIEDPSSINQDTVTEDAVLDPGDIRAALSSASDGGHDGTINQFDPLHVVAQGPTAQPNAHGTLHEIPATTPPLQQSQMLPSAENMSPSYPERQHCEDITATSESQGPLWKQAGMMAAAAESQQQYHQFDPQQGKMTKRAAIEQAIRDECWSRAAVDSGEVAPDTLFRGAAGGHSESERVATKRVNVVQLLINGLIGFVGGLLGSIYVQLGCHFVTVDVGLSLHFGLWQYSPMDSALQGFTYCYPYDEEYTHDSPTFARIFGLIALISGLFSLSVLWVYLLLGRTSNGLWKWAVRFLVVAASFQALTFSFFADAVCRRNSCSFGPGSIVSLISTLSWALVAYEMRDNSPTATAALISDPHLEAGDTTNQEQQGGTTMELTGYRPPVSLGVNV